MIRWRSDRTTVRGYLSWNRVSASRNKILKRNRVEETFRSGGIRDRIICLIRRKRIVVVDSDDFRDLLLIPVTIPAVPSVISAMTLSLFPRRDGAVKRVDRRSDPSD